jgi:hypothetical protein
MWLAEIIAIIKGFDRALNQIMVVVVGVGGRIAGVPQLHLRGDVDDGARWQHGEGNR